MVSNEAEQRPVEWIVQLTYDETPMRVRYCGMVLGVVGPWQIIDPGGPRDGKYVAERDVAEILARG